MEKMEDREQKFLSKIERKLEVTAEKLQEIRESFSQTIISIKEKVFVAGYYSRTLSKPERNYCVTRRELLAVLECIKHYHKYLYGQHFLLKTDHSALRWLLQFKIPEGQLARWIECLQTYDLQKHIGHYRTVCG